MRFDEGDEERGVVLSEGGNLKKKIFRLRNTMVTINADQHIRV